MATAWHRFALENRKKGYRPLSFPHIYICSKKAGILGKVKNTNTSLNTVQERIAAQTTNTLQEMKTLPSSRNAPQPEKQRKTQQPQSKKTRATEKRCIDQSILQGALLVELLI